MQKCKFINEVEFFANFMNEKIELGNIYSVDDGELALQGNLSDFIDDIDITNPKYFAVSSKALFTRTTENSTSVIFNAQATIKVGEAQCIVKFEKDNSSFISLNNAYTKALKLGMVEDVIIRLWTRKEWLKRRSGIIFINKLMEAESGVVLHSALANTVIGIAADVSTPLMNISDIANGKVKIETKNSAIISIINSDIHQPFFNALWWKPQLKKWEELG